MDAKLSELKRISILILDKYTEYGIWSRIKYVPNDRLETKIQEIIDLLPIESEIINYKYFKECVEMILTLCMSFPNYEADCPYINELQQDLYIIEKWLLDVLMIVYPEITLKIKN